MVTSNPMGMTRYFPKMEKRAHQKCGGGKGRWGIGDEVGGLWGSGRWVMGVR